MQASMTWRTKRQLKRYLLVGVVCALFAWGFTHAQWTNDEPWWEYEDDSPMIPMDVRLKIHNISQTWSQAYDYHNKRFKPVYNQREGENAAFATRWNLSFVPYWTTFNAVLYDYIASKLQVESKTMVSGTVVDFDHSRLAAKTRMIAAGLVEKARVLTLYLDNDTVRARWEIFTQRLITLEEVIKELD